ncbi:hypothetical protein AAGG91_002682 [Salmonella enterica]|nr:hypothetical protein [Salmonella enterica]
MIKGNFYNDLRIRYLEILDTRAENDTDHPTSRHHLSWMLNELSSDTMSETKKHRWLGYVQGCMVSQNLINVEDERNATRNIFNGT